jgi:PAS domain-containing protein
VERVGRHLHGVPDTEGFADAEVVEVPEARQSAGWVLSSEGETVGGVQPLPPRQSGARIQINGMDAEISGEGFPAFSEDPQGGQLDSATRLATNVGLDEGTDSDVIEQTRAAPTQPAPDDAAGFGRVLMIEPSGQLAQIQRNLLERQGIASDWVPDAAAAARVLAAGAYDLVLASLPGGPAESVATLQAIREVRPGQAVVLVAGPRERAAAEALVPHGAAGVLIRDDAFVQTFGRRAAELLGRAGAGDADAHVVGADAADAAEAEMPVVEAAAADGSEDLMEVEPLIDAEPLDDVHAHDVPEIVPEPSLISDPLAGFFEQSPGGLFRLTADGLVMGLNPRMGSMLGLDRPEGYIGRSMRDTLAADAAEFDALLSAAASPAGVEGRVVSLRRGDGSVLRTTVSLRRATDGHGKTSHYDGLALPMSAAPAPPPAAPQTGPSPLPADAAALVEALSARLEVIRAAVGETAETLARLKALLAAAPPVPATPQAGKSSPAAGSTPAKSAPAANTNVPAANVPLSNVPAAKPAPPAGAAVAKPTNASAKPAPAAGPAQPVKPDPPVKPAAAESPGPAAAKPEGVMTTTSQMFVLADVQAAAKLAAPPPAKPNRSGERSGERPGSTAEAPIKPPASAAPQVAAKSAPATPAPAAKPAPARPVAAAAPAKPAPARPVAAAAPAKPAAAPITAAVVRRSSDRLEPARPEPGSVVLEPVGPSSSSSDAIPAPAVPARAAEILSQGPAQGGQVQMTSSGFFNVDSMTGGPPGGPGSGVRSGRAEGGSPADFELLDLNALVRQAVWYAEPKIQAAGLKIEIHQKFGQCRPVRGNRARIREVIARLLLNAMELMPGGGRIIVSTGEMPKGVFAAVTNTGAGIPAHVKDSIFAPDFVPTQNWQKALRECLQVMLRHDGKIGLISEPGKGVTVTIRLPPAPASQ